MVACILENKHIDILFNSFFFLPFVFFFQIDSSGEIICFAEGGAPWKDHLFAIEEELNISPPIKYVLYTDNNGAWRVQCVPLKLGSFDNRWDLSGTVEPPDE